MGLTNLGLVEHVKMALSQKWGYVWGTFGSTLTPELLAAKVRQYGDAVNRHFDFIKDNWMGRHVADCVGLIKSYMWWGEDGKPHYAPTTDVSADGMFNKASVKGSIETVPDVPGVCVYKKGHIGVYIGDGQVIESHGTRYGVIQTPLRGEGSTAWTGWLMCPFIEYVEEAPVAAPEPVKMGVPFKEKVLRFQKACNLLGVKDANGDKLDEDGKLGKLTMQAIKKSGAVVRRGDRNPLVGAAQFALGIKVDNSYGKAPYHETYDAIGNFQAQGGLRVDHTVGPITWLELLSC